MTSTVNYIKSNTSHPLGCPAWFFELDYVYEICEYLAVEREHHFQRRHINIRNLIDRIFDNDPDRAACTYVTHPNQVEEFGIANFHCCIFIYPSQKSSKIVL